MGPVLVLVEHDRGALALSTLEALTVARSLSDEVAALVCGDYDLAGDLGDYGAETVYVAANEVLSDYGPEAWGETLVQAIAEIEPEAVMASGTSKGNEVLAQAAARLDTPFVANCVEFSDDLSEMTRVQWGGSLLERVSLTTDLKIVSVAEHALEALPSGGSADTEELDVDLDDKLIRTRVIGREIAEPGVTLATAPVVIGGGRGVGNVDGFAPLEELADLLGGRVGCSRAVTNNGWRPHADQVGQTGTRIAPEIYIATGISGAIQHWVGAMASKVILAVNTDPEANMVTKADYAVIGDLHEVVPAITTEIVRRRG